jgi:hypothetical protein
VVTLLRPWRAPEAEAPPLPAGPCANCGDETPGRYCPSCGQARRERLASLREMLADFVDDQLSLNSRLPRTVGLLLLHPGALTREYLQGRIARYIRPFRLYLGASVLFFVLLSLQRGGPDTNVGQQEGAPAVTPAASGGKSWVDDIQLETGIPSIDRRVAAKKERYRYVRPGEAFRSVTDEFLEYVPTMVFLLLPVYALLLKLLYLRRRRLYVEHFVFALHLHAFVFALFTLMLLTGGFLSELLTLWMMVYIFLAMRRVYGQSWLKTGVKYVVLGWSYSSILFLALLATALAALLLT